MNTGTLYATVSSAFSPGRAMISLSRISSAARRKGRRNRGIPDRRADSRRIKTENVSGTADADDKRQGIVGKKS